LFPIGEKRIRFGRQDVAAFLLERMDCDAPEAEELREHLAKQRTERERARETTGYKSKSELPSALDRFSRR